MHWFPRAVIAVAVGALAVAPTGNLVNRFGRLADSLPRPWGTLIVIGCVGAASSAITMIAYGLLTRRFGPKEDHTETRCRKCGYILRGITEPRCPECGEVI